MILPAKPISQRFCPLSAASVAFFWVFYPLGYAYLWLIARKDFWQELPFLLPETFVVFFFISLILHAIFAPLLVAARGVVFWLLPLMTLPAAGILLGMFWLSAHVALYQVAGSPFAGTVDLLGDWMLGLVLVIVFHIWILYPLTVGTHFLIRLILRRNELLPPPLPLHTPVP